jgi:ethanolamine utilization protein EutM
MGEALGMIETRGLVAAIEAADAALKAAPVTLERKAHAGAARVTIVLRGEVAAVQAAVEAGAQAAKRVGRLLAVHVIPRPDEAVDDLVGEPLRGLGLRRQGAACVVFAGTPGPAPETPAAPRGKGKKR